MHIKIYDNYYVNLVDLDEYYKTRSMFYLNDVVKLIENDPNDKRLPKCLPNFFEGLIMYLRDTFELLQLNISKKVNLQSEI